MKSAYKISIICVLAAVLFIPFYPVTVVPEWEIIFSNKDGTKASIVRMAQTWQDYSLGSGENIEKNLMSDSEGYTKLPARQIRVSVFQIIYSRIRDVVASINPHASFGSDSAVFCDIPHKCVVAYKADNEKPQRFVLW